MHPTTPNTSKTRVISISLGLLLGMCAGTLAPSMAHAAKPRPAKTAEQLPSASAEQLAAVERVLTGRYGCEFGKSIEVARHAVHAGYVTLKLAKDTWTMKPVVSSTGAVRLEDVKGRTLLLQILTKSMLMDTKSGRRMVDACVHDTQRAAEEHLRANPQPSALN
ncbi:hypothetical protein EYS42_06945 [Aquabacterium lacunae]|uniref:Uncharacterized protein n=1 Tax=Aquabacterium lacunae TaxID=2528630 RepID=A0A4Q9H572_9BURK|nr:hypothetical protein [Aquabacterium lacunae]TBO32894.1 hypothetical protein EYS42_06945 [Aquabacterium lacunae]